MRRPASLVLALAAACLAVAGAARRAPRPPRASRSDVATDPDRVRQRRRQERLHPVDDRGHRRASRSTLSIFNTTDVPHGFAIPGLKVEAVLPPQEEHEVELPALEARQVYADQLSAAPAAPHARRWWCCPARSSGGGEARHSAPSGRHPSGAASPAAARRARGLPKTRPSLPPRAGSVTQRPPASGTSTCVAAASQRLSERSTIASTPPPITCAWPKASV